MSSEIEWTVRLEGEDRAVELARTGAKELPPELVGTPQDVQELGAKSGAAARTTVMEEQQGISHRRLVIIVIGLCLTIFLTALDQTIVSTAVPTIVEDLGDASGYTWIGTSYLLASYHPSLQKLLILEPFHSHCTAKPPTSGAVNQSSLSHSGYSSSAVLYAAQVKT
jgi:hypothetical protein